MIKTTKILVEELNNYSQPVNKIYRMIKNKEIFPIVQGIYETNEHVDPFYIASVICNPSYISFESALSYYGLIPEGVYATTCASFKKRKTHKYSTNFGAFIFEDVPKQVYPYGIELVVVDKNYSYQIATKEKALCDKLYKLPAISNKEELEKMLFNYLRIDEDILYTFDINLLALLSEKYHSKNVTLLYKFLRRKNNEYNR